MGAETHLHPGGVGPAEKISILLNSVLAGRGVSVPVKVLLNPSLA